MARFRRLDITVDSPYGDHTYRLYADCSEGDKFTLYAPTDWENYTFSDWSLDDDGLLFQGAVVNGASYKWIDSAPCQEAEDKLNQRIKDEH